MQIRRKSFNQIEVSSFFSISLENLFLVTDESFSKGSTKNRPFPDQTGKKALDIFSVNIKQNKGKNEKEELGTKNYSIYHYKVTNKKFAK